MFRWKKKGKTKVAGLGKSETKNSVRDFKGKWYELDKNEDKKSKRRKYNNWCLNEKDSDNKKKERETKRTVEIYRDEWNKLDK